MGDKYGENYGDKSYVKGLDLNLYV
jgi:hypothetical protein